MAYICTSCRILDETIPYDEAFHQENNQHNETILKQAYNSNYVTTTTNRSLLQTCNIMGLNQIASGTYPKIPVDLPTDKQVKPLTTPKM